MEIVLGNFAFKLTPSFMTLMFTFFILLIFIFFFRSALKKTKNDEVNGLFLGTVDMLFDTANSFVAGFVGEKESSKYVPLFFVTFFVIFVGNSLSVFKFTEIAIDISIPLTLTIVMFIVWNYVAIKETGLKNFFKGFFEPIPLLFPIEILGFLAKPLSLTVRMFGNILSGYIIMILLWEFNQVLFELSTSIFAIDSLSRILAIILVGIIGILQLYFALFSSFIQATVFTSLSMSNIGESIEN